jgi:D-alanyl-D-alanine carboxypeptidase
MKTGFICASGFNVVASATRNGRRLITVVMGSTSAAERTIKAAALFDHGFNSWGLGSPTVEQLPASNLINAPNMRPIICERRGPLPAEEDAQPAAAQSDDGARVQPPATALAFAATGSTPGTRPQLGPRARFEPILVWTGRTPPSALAARAEEKAPANAAKPRQKPVRAAKPAPVPPAAQAFAATEPKTIIEEGRGSGNKGAIQPGAALASKPASALPKPKAAATGGERPKAGAIAAKPKPAQSAAVAGAKPSVSSKPSAAAKPAAAKPALGSKPAAKQATKNLEQKKPQAAAKPKTAARAKPQAE